MRRRKPQVEGQESLPDTRFLPGELWCTLCGGPVVMIWERKFMICGTCNPTTKREIQHTGKTFQQWTQTKAYQKALKVVSKLLESTNEEG